jgi:hypothetical protein
MAVMSEAVTPRSWVTLMEMVEARALPGPPVVVALTKGAARTSGGVGEVSDMDFFLCWTDLVKQKTQLFAERGGTLDRRPVKALLDLLKHCDDRGADLGAALVEEMEVEVLADVAEGVGRYRELVADFVGGGVPLEEVVASVVGGGVVVEDVGVGGEEAGEGAEVVGEGEAFEEGGVGLAGAIADESEAAGRSAGKDGETEDGGGEFADEGVGDFVCELVGGDGDGGTVAAEEREDGGGVGSGDDGDGEDDGVGVAEGVGEVDAGRGGELVVGGGEVAEGVAVHVCEVGVLEEGGGGGGSLFEVGEEFGDGGAEDGVITLEEEFLLGDGGAVADDGTVGGLDVGDGDEADEGVVE